MAQREGCGLPTYFTEKSGEAHAPTFISKVEIDGVSFTGKEARTKKQAEMSAAKIAYTARRRWLVLNGDAGLCCVFMHIHGRCVHAYDTIEQCTDIQTFLTILEYKSVSQDRE